MASARTPRSTRPSLADRARFYLRRKLVKRVRVSDGEHEYEFRCESALDVVRAQTLLVKERGTVQWIRDSVKPGDVFYDIGANIGIYTPLAAQRVGPAGRVYAFEPHVVNVHALMHNIKANGLGGVVQVMSCALNDREGFFDFNYYSDVSGSSNSQLNELRDGNEREFRPVLTEHKQATTVDALIAAGAIRPATHIKLDVDGNEMLILRGMTRLLGGSGAPATVHVEVNPRYRAELFEFMRERGFELRLRHYTLEGEAKLAAGADAEEISYNAVFQHERARR
jgi:FkbM family methyltransferase